MAAQYFRKSQNNEGSWYYDHGIETASIRKLPTMTCAGLLGLAVGHGIAAEGQYPSEKLDARAVDKAMEHLGSYLNRPNCPFDLYFIWSVERVGVLYDKKKIGGKDWYAWGRQQLLSRQDKLHGNWKDEGYFGSKPTIDTCFACLFLKQANLAKDLTSKLHLLGR